MTPVALPRPQEGSMRAKPAFLGHVYQLPATVPRRREQDSIGMEEHSLCGDIVAVLHPGTWAGWLDYGHSTRVGQRVVW